MILETDGTVWSVADYFSRWGFGDGDDGVQKEHARRHRAAVVRALNETMARRALPWTAEAEDAPGVHNELRAVVRDEDGEEVEIAAVCDRVEYHGARGYPPRPRNERHERLFAVLEALWPEFVARAEAAVKASARR